MILKYVTAEINRIMLKKETCDNTSLHESVTDKCVDDTIFAPVVDWLCNMLTQQR